MNNNVKTVTLEPVEFLSTLSTIKSIKAVAISQDDNEEANLMNELIEKLLTYDLSQDDNVTLELDTQARFAIWLALDVYCSFCITNMYTDELLKTKAIMVKFQ